MSERNIVHDEELEMQKEAMSKIRAINDKYTEETGRKKKYFIFTTGCQMNAHDSEKQIGRAHV